MPAGLFPFLRRGFVPLLIVAWLSSAASVLAHPSAAEIATTWTGLERAGYPAGTRVFTLVLGETPAEASSDPRPTSLPLAAQPGKKLSGTWTARLVARDHRGRQPAPVVETVAAEYFTEVGILRVTRRPERGGAGYDCLIIFDADVSRLAGVYTGGLRDATPFAAVRGSALSPELAALTGLTRDQLRAAVGDAATSVTSGGDDRVQLAEAYAAGDRARVRTILEAQTRPVAATPTSGTTAPAPRNLEAEFQAVMLETQEALQAGDTTRVRELQQKAAEIRAGMAAQRQRPAMPVPAAGPARSRCPEHITAWAAELDVNGASSAVMGGTSELSNLFRPRLFARFFGQPFANLSPEERATIGRDMQRNCIMDGTPFGQSGNVNALVGAFQSTPGYDTADAGLGGIALELVADWAWRSVQDLATGSDAARVADVELKSTQLVARLWPREIDAARRQFAALKSRNHGQRLLAEIDSLAHAAAGGSADALERLARLPEYADAVKLSPADRAPFDRKHATAFAESIARFLARARGEALSPSPGLDQLLRSKAWLAVHGNALAALRSHADGAAFHRDFVAARAASYAAEQARMAREIAALDSRETLERYATPFAIYSDADTSPAWKELDAQRQARIREFERREFLARTGDGPFGPDHPGAIYLNALWRNDQPLLAELDRRYREPYLASLTMLESIDYTPGLAERLTGGAFSADQYRRQRRAIAGEASLANPLLVLFAFEYEHVYKSCLDPDPVEFRVHLRHETTVRNGMGLMVGTLPAGTTTIVHHVNQRHADAVRDLGIADPNDRVVSEAFLGGFRSPVSYVSAGDGLTMAMRQYPCDSEVIRRIEAGLLARWEIFAARKREIKRRILGE